MKKFLLTITAAAMALTSMAAIPFGMKKADLHPERRPDIKMTHVTSPVKPLSSKTTRADEEETEAETKAIYYTLAGNPADGLGYPNQTPSMQMAMAFQIEESFLAGVKDGEITAVTFYTGTQEGAPADKQVNKILHANVFVASALDGTYLYEQEVKCPETAFTQVVAEFKEPFAIPADTPIYVGVYFTLTDSKNVAIIVDSEPHLNNNGGWVGVRNNTATSWRWENVADDFGFVTLGAIIQASEMPENSISVLAVDGQPVAATGQEIPFQFLLINNGVNSVSTLTLEYGLEGEEPVVQDMQLEEPLYFNQILIGGIANFTSSVPTKKSNINFRIKAVDGMENTASDPSGSYTVTIVPAESDLSRNIVIEEFTSISCTWCPVGYTSMEMIHENFTDGTIIPVCIHINSPGRDPMTATSYNGVVNAFCTQGVPSSVVNRAYNVYPLYDDLVDMATVLRTLPAVGAVEAEATIDPATRELTINTKTKFAFDYTDGDENFILSFGITENDLGPYTQQNGYSGADYDVIGGWQDLDKTVELTYNDVARQLDKFAGIKGSVPAEITAGEEYEYTHTLSVLKAVKDLEKINVIVYLINPRTKEIENACMLKSIGDGSYVSGVEETILTEDDSDAPAEYYNLQGIRVANPSNGLYIVRKGNSVKKIIVK